MFYNVPAALDQPRDCGPGGRETQRPQIWLLPLGGRLVRAFTPIMLTPIRKPTLTRGRYAYHS